VRYGPNVIRSAERTRFTTAVNGVASKTLRADGAERRRRRDSLADEGSPNRRRMI